MHEGISIPVSSPSITDLELDNVAEALKSQWISSMSPYVKGFEDGFSKYVGVRHGVATNSGTTALHLALAALGVGAGNEVIIPTFTMIATANVVEYQRAIIKLVDADPHTWNIDTDAIEDQITDKTKVIMPVDIYGYPSDFDKIRKISDKYGLTVIEDAAEAHGAVSQGGKVVALEILGASVFFEKRLFPPAEGGWELKTNKNWPEKRLGLRPLPFAEGENHFGNADWGLVSGCPDYRVPLV